VRAYEESKQKGTVKFIGTDDRDPNLKYNHVLDDLWQHVRAFLDDLNSKGEKREIGKGDRSNRLKLLEACQSFDFTDEGVITEANLLTALSRSRYRPLPTAEQLGELVRALEANVAEGDVNYRRILEAPVKREFTSINNIFPLIVSDPLNRALH